MPPRFHKLLLLFYTHSSKHNQISATWKTSPNILLCEKGNLTGSQIIDQLPSLIHIHQYTYQCSLYIWGKTPNLPRQSRRIQSLKMRLMIITNHHLGTNHENYILYIDFKNAFGSINHPRLFAIIKDLGYPQDIVALLRNIYSQSTTTFIEEYFCKIQPIFMQRETILGDIMSPYLFIIFLEPLLATKRKLCNMRE